MESLSIDLKTLLRILHEMDRAGVKARDLQLLYLINESPGASGSGLYPKMGLKSRSLLNSAIDRLLSLGLIEDRRPVRKRAHVAYLYVTEKGERALANPLQLYDIVNEPEGL